MEDWRQAQEYERNWWFSSTQQHPTEQAKSRVVAGLICVANGRPNHAVIDIGAGPFSLLQRLPVKTGTALDPIDYGPLEAGYRRLGIRRLIKKAEDLTPEDGVWDEAWIYNCLQHVEDPGQVLKAVGTIANLVRLFEWINMPPCQGHLHELHSEAIREAFTGWQIHAEFEGRLNSSGLYGRFFVGIWEKTGLSDSVL